MSKVASVKAMLLRKLNGIVVVEHATEDGIKQARSYGTTLASFNEIKPRNANEILKSTFVLKLSIPMYQKIAIGLFLEFITYLPCIQLFFV